MIIIWIAKWVAGLLGVFSLFGGALYLLDHWRGRTRLDFMDKFWTALIMVAAALLLWWSGLGVIV